MPLLFVFACGAQAATVTVNDAGDSSNACATTGTGTCTLRDALAYANAHSGSTIAFDISGAGVQTITPMTAYPTITAPVTIDGFTQPGASPNSNGPGLGDNSVHLIVVSGSALMTDGLILGAGSDGSTIRGLVLNHWFSRDITLSSDSNTVAGNFLGTDPAGTTGEPGGNGNVGIFVFAPSASHNVIGGTAPADRNLISGHPSGGIIVYVTTAVTIQGDFIGTDATGALAIANSYGIDTTSGSNLIGGTTTGAGNVISGNTSYGISFAAAAVGPVEGNLIGTDVTGTKPLPNVGGPGVLLNDATGVTIGGPAAGAGNVISGNGQSGISVLNGANNVIQGNKIGTDITGTLPLGNALVEGSATFGGVFLDGPNGTIIGGGNPGEGNVIAFNSGNGVTVFGFGTETGNTVRGNAIFDQVTIPFPIHPQLAIDIADDGPTPNDPCDGDSGSNGLQNYPIITSASPSGGGTHVTGILNSTASTEFTLDFYGNPKCLPHPHDYYEAHVYLGSAVTTTGGDCVASFDVTLPVAIQPTDVVTATATDPNGNTSELSPRLVYTILPTSGPAAAGTAVMVDGTNFESGATLTIGGQAATSVVANGAQTQITAVTPALSPGTVNDVTVTDPDTIAGTLSKGFVADFLDVPPSNGFYSYVTTLVANAITVGVGGGLYGVNNDTLRQQMAVFLLKAKHGVCYVPPSCIGVFMDVPCPSTFANWIEALAAEGITGGCGGGNFCPQNPVRRDQMAVFLLKDEHGSSYAPPPCAGVFSDVPCPSTFANWIEQLAAEMITGGCGGGMYCPGNPNTRGQMAVFITKTFHLQ